MTGCNTLVPLLFLARKLRRNLAALFVIGLLINVGMWFERYVIIVTSLSHGFLPSSWHLYHPSWVECSISVGAGCFFLFMLLVTLKIVPGVSVVESKTEPEPVEVAAG
jgi:molybdopterin-containing oxidoreductase family membrane subunit